MMSRFLVVVVLFSQLGLSDAHAGQFDGLGRRMARAGFQLGKRLGTSLTDFNVNQSVGQHRNYIPVGRPRSPSQKTGKTSHGSSSPNWGNLVVGVAGASGLGIVGYQVYQVSSHNEETGKNFDIKLIENLIQISLHELDAAVEKDLSNDKDALNDLLEKIRTVKAFYYQEYTSPEIRDVLEKFFSQFKNNDLFMNNLKAANDQENRAWMITDLEFNASVDLPKLSQTQEEHHS